MQYGTHAKLSPHKHGFFTRNGGVSGGIYATANMAFTSGDCGDNVHENRNRVKHALNLAHLITLTQVHGNVVHTVTADTMQHFQNTTVTGDGLVCAVPHVGIGILTADCAPVLFIDSHNKVAGACHAGWGGAQQGVMLRTVDAMIHAGADIPKIVAVIGPSIVRTSYEVDTQFKQNFCANHPDYHTYFTRWRDLNTPVPSCVSDSYGFDLTGFIRDRLCAYGVRTYAIDNMDTYTQPDVFFSYRRTTHKNESDYGRQISVICV